MNPIFEIGDEVEIKNKKTYSALFEAEFAYWNTTGKIIHITILQTLILYSVEFPKQILGGHRGIKNSGKQRQCKNFSEEEIILTLRGHIKAAIKRKEEKK